MREDDGVAVIWVIRSARPEHLSDGCLSATAKRVAAVHTFSTVGRYPGSRRVESAGPGSTAANT